MKKFLILLCAMMLTVRPALSQTRESYINLEGEQCPVTETLYRSSLGYALWYDSALMAVDESMSESGKSFIIEPLASDIPAYLEIMSADVFGMEPLAFLKMNAHDDRQYDSRLTEDGITVYSFSDTHPGNADLVNTYYAVDDREGGLVAVATCSMEALEGWGARLDRVMRTLHRWHAASLPMCAVWEEAVEQTAVVLDRVQLTQDESAVWVAFVAQEEVKDFRIMELEGELDDDGHVRFEERVLYERAEMSGTQAVLVQLTFYGDLVPNNGISFTDVQGAAHRYALSISGEDGLLELTAY